MKIDTMHKKVKRIFPGIRTALEAVPEERRTCFLPIDAALWLIVLLFMFRRAYSLLKIDEYLRGLPLYEATGLYHMLVGKVTPKAMEQLREKATRKEPLISDSHLSDIIASVKPEYLDGLLLDMTMKARRNKTWEGLIVAAYDGTKQGACRKSRCPFCKSTDSGKSYFHLAVHLKQVNARPYLTMAHRFVKAGEGELTVAKAIARELIQMCRGKYADIIVVDALYCDAEFINLHREAGMDVLIRGQEKNPDKPLRDLTIFHDAKLLFDSDQPESIPVTFTDEARQRTIRAWDTEGLTSWEGVEGPLRALRLEVTCIRNGDTKATTQVHWAATTIPRSRKSAEAIYHQSVQRWVIENNGFRQEKSFEALEHMPLHDPTGDGLRVFALLYLIAANLLEWLAYRHFPAIRKRLLNTRYALVHLREDLQDQWTRWLASTAISLKALMRPPPACPSR